MRHGRSSKQHNKVLLSIKDLYTHCSLGNDYIDPIYTLAWIYDYYNPITIIHDMYCIPEDNYTHYTPHRCSHTIVHTASTRLSLNTGSWRYEHIINICYLTIKGIILHEWQKNNYTDFYDICHKNLRCDTLFKKNIDLCLKQIYLQDGLLHECLPQIRSF
jgi:hypothetical protein